MTEAPKDEAKRVAFEVDLGNSVKVANHAILVGYRGSVTHGTYRPPTNANSIDDIDLIGVVIMPLEYYFGLKNFKTKEAWEGKYDMVFYDIRQYFNLLLKNNPNVNSLLWLRPQHYIYVSELGRRLIANRDIFISKQAYKAYAGYASAQLRKMEHCACKGYMGEKRKQLVEKFGYDTKNAAHLVRILRQGIELLLSGELTVFRPDFQEILDIKDGKYKLEEVKKMAEGLFAEAKAAEMQSSLPEKPDYDRANQLLVNFIREYYFS